MSRQSVAAIAASIALLTLLSPALAQERTALVGGRLIDGFGHAPINDSVILIYDDTILDVGTVDTLPVPDSYTVVSTEGMDLLPGLWESHAHLMLAGHADYAHWDATYADRLADEILIIEPAHENYVPSAIFAGATPGGVPLRAKVTDFGLALARGETIQREAPEVALRAAHAAVDVDRVTERLEGVEGDADGQQDIEMRYLVQQVELLK